MAQSGIVVIGRNEGDRLGLCLRSVLKSRCPVVYVDSGSSDGSTAIARQLGCTVVELNPSQPFTAARARNEGFVRLRELAPEATYVQFVDGDCEMDEGWLGLGSAHLDEHSAIVVVCGNVTERSPEASVYNRLCEVEWRMPIGEIRACGGIFMIRAAAFEGVKGFRPEVLAAEDDDLCLRLRAAGGKVVHIDANMVLHDAAIMRFGAWWMRSKRAGYAFAHGWALHGRREIDSGHFARNSRSVRFWALVLPLSTLILARPTDGLSLSLLCAFPLQMARLAWLERRHHGTAWFDALLIGFFMILFKFPALVGELEYRLRRQQRISVAPYDYKRTPRAL